MSGARSTNAAWGGRRALSLRAAQRPCPAAETTGGRTRSPTPAERSASPRLRRTTGGAAGMRAMRLRQQVREAGEARVRAYRMMLAIDASLAEIGVNIALPHGAPYWLLRKEFLQQKVSELLKGHRFRGLNPQQRRDQLAELSYLRARRDWLATMANWNMASGKVLCRAAQPAACRDGPPQSLVARL